MAIKEMIVKVVEGRGLRETEAAAAMLDIVEGLATPSQIAAFVTALRMKGETAEEIAGLARIMRRYATRVETSPDAIDIVGTGGDGGRTFNISTVSALVVAAAGGKVAKHGNRGVTSSCGAADILEAFGVAFDLPPDAVADCINETGFGFMFAPIYHPAMRHAVVPRREIGVRTAFNLLGPITNPAGVTSQVTGVGVASVTPVIAEVLRLLGSKRALVVHSKDGLDELSICAPTTVYDVADGTVREYEVAPEAVGLKRAPMAAITGGTVESNLRMAQAVLAGDQGGPRDAILLNAAAGMVCAGLAEDIPAGVKLAATAIDTGKARAKLDQVREVSSSLKSAAVAS
ncbi:MAG TPA: anthranilate phosphoribosyltransferase [Chloroflexota bacterium]|nr:anthranilate phosphoribosyltransferase [Chloroflexota bacterium]